MLYLAVVQVSAQMIPVDYDDYRYYKEEHFFRRTGKFQHSKLATSHRRTARLSKDLLAQA
jgi:hypothetical protein